MSGRRGGGREGVELRLLGPFEALRGGAPVPLGGAKPATLLAALALEVGRSVSADLLVEALWPGTPPDTAAHAVQVYVSQLRKALGADSVVRRGGGYVLELDPDRLDVRRFARLVGEGRDALAGGDAAAASTILRESIGLWRGPALADFLYEPFAQADIARLEELRLDAVEARIDADLALGRHVDLVPELEALVQAHPLREHPRAQLMLALYRSGRQADALAAYRAARETLVEELGLEPGHELRELEASILRQDGSLLLPETVPAMPAMQFRRLVTILFVDVVDSMAVTEALDPEALGGVQRRYFETVSAALSRHGGMVETYAGDAVMAAFGVPVSHEDDALRAARAAFDITTGIAALSDELERIHGLGLEVRIGLAASEVVAVSTKSRQRFVAGDAVGVAARLQHAAEPGKIVVGEVVARLIDHAARLEPLGTLEVTSRKAPIAMYRLVELEPAAPAFEHRLDAKLVGRRRELAALRKAAKRAVDDASVRVSVIVGPPGVGKSRLAAELARRAKGARTLWGRCLSYGDGITFWPLREAAEQAPGGEERAAFLAALDDDTPPSAAEIGLAFRRLCESLARERSLLVVLDDVHWAEPTLLEVVEGLADRGQGPIHVVCVAREELLENAPGFLEGRKAAERIVLDALSSDEAEELLDRLGAGALESDQRDRIAATAEGNPFFLEQLLALALEGGLVERALPPTVQALLAARLDRLGPGERAVLERGAVAGKEFRADDVASLLDPAAVPTLDTHLRVLAERGFVRPVGEGAFAFRHVLVQDAVYRSAPKRLRAELHERYADRLDEAYPELAELDEFAGYHLEQAHRLRLDLGEGDRRMEQLAEDAGTRLGEAGMRAFKRGDMYASTNLLERATGLLPANETYRRDLLCDLGLSYSALQDPERAVELLSRVLEESRDPWDARTSARARIELEYIRVRREPGRTADALLEAIEESMPLFERVGDRRALGRALLLYGWIQGGRRGNHAAWVEAAERALDSYVAAGWPITTCLGEIAAGLYWGRTHIHDAIGRIEGLYDAALGRQVKASLETFLAGLVAQLGEFERARALLGSARAALEDLGMRGPALTYSAAVLGEVELLAGNPREAESVLRELCSRLDTSEDLFQLASRASDLAEALIMQDAIDEAEEWTRVAEKHAARDDVKAQMMWRPLQATIQARRRAFHCAEQLAREGVAIADTSDDLNRRARAYAALATVLRAAGRPPEADTARRHAIELFEQKGNRVGADRLRALEGELTSV